MPKTTITSKIEAEMTPAVKAFVFAMFDQFEKRIEELELQVDICPDKLQSWQAPTGQ